MATKKRPQSATGGSSRLDRATFRPGDYGRVTQPDGTDRWWVRSGSGTWLALSHGRVAENDDGSITVLYLGRDEAEPGR